jgi:hypothetical protein
MRLWRMADGSSGTDSLARSGNARLALEPASHCWWACLPQAGVSGGPRCR